MYFAALQYIFAHLNLARWFIKVNIFFPILTGNKAAVL
jgi:hypothetical protein